jgi:hypothetical protein
VNPLSYSLAAQAKALVAVGVIAALTYLVALDRPSVAAIDLGDALKSALAFFVAYATVFGVPNR